MVEHHARQTCKGVGRGFFGVNGLLEKIRCADQVSMSWILLGLLLEEREAFDFSDSLVLEGLRKEQVGGKVKFAI
jgi:hypothetical protein